jgi:hypothetical protein
MMGKECLKMDMIVEQKSLPKLHHKVQPRVAPALR